MEAPPQVRHLASVLRWASLALALALVGSLLTQLLPPVPNSSAWQLQFADSLIAQAPLLVLALCLVQLAAWLDGGSPASTRLVRFSRRLALPLALLYLLLIPLQGIVGLTAWRSDVAAGVEQVGRLRQGISRLRIDAGQVSSASQLEDLLRRLPRGGPPPASLGSDLATQKRQLLIGLDQASRQLDAAASQRRLQGLQATARRFARVLLSAMGVVGLLVVLSEWRPLRNRRHAGLLGWHPSLARFGLRRGRRRPSPSAYLRRLSREQSGP
jgi:hypothetical protein